MSQDAPDRRPRLLTLARLAWTGVGLFIFIYFVRRAGLSELTSGVRNIGWGFLAIVLLGGLRFAARALAWQRCIEGQPRPGFPALLRGTLAGDAAGHLTPLGLFVSEPAKALYVAHEVPLVRAASALAVENFFYTLSAFLVISVGLLLLPLAFRTPAGWSTISAGIITILLGLVGLVHLVLSHRVMTVSRCAAWLDRIRGRQTGRGTIADRVTVLETKTFDLYNRSRRHLAVLAFFELGFHIAGVVEVYVTLALLTGERPTLARGVSVRVVEPARERRLQVRSDAPRCGRGGHSDVCVTPAVHDRNGCRRGHRPQGENGRVGDDRRGAARQASRMD